LDSKTTKEAVLEHQVRSDEKLIVFYNSETLKVISIQTKRTSDNSPLKAEDKKDGYFIPPPDPIRAFQTTDNKMIARAWEAMDAIGGEIYVKLNRLKNVSDIYAKPIDMGEDR
jgi:hypothetical protein